MPTPEYIKRANAAYIQRLKEAGTYKQKIIEKKQEYYEQNKEKCLEQKRARYRAANPEVKRKPCANDTERKERKREYMREYNAKRKAKQLALAKAKVDAPSE